MDASYDDWHNMNTVLSHTQKVIKVVNHEELICVTKNKVDDQEQQNIDFLELGTTINSEITLQKLKS